MDEDNSLIHYGVKGMKWGIRKARPTSGVRRVKRSKVKSTFKRLRSVPVSTIKKVASGARQFAENRRDSKLKRVTQQAKIQEQETRLAQQKLQEEMNKRNLKEAKQSNVTKVGKKIAAAVGKAAGNAALGMAKSAGHLASEAVKDRLAKNTWNKYGSKDIKDLNDRQLEKMEKRLERQNKVAEAMKKATKKPANSFAVAKSKIKKDPLTGQLDFSGLNDDELKEVYNRYAVEDWLINNKVPNARFFTSI